MSYFSVQANFSCIFRVLLRHKFEAYIGLALITFLAACTPAATDAPPVNEPIRQVTATERIPERTFMVVDGSAMKWRWSGKAPRGWCGDLIDIENTIKPQILSSIKSMARDTYADIKFLDSIKSVESLQPEKGHTLAIIRLKFVEINMEEKFGLIRHTYVNTGYITFDSILDNEETKPVRFSTSSTFQDSNNLPLLAGLNICSVIKDQMRRTANRTLVKGITALQIDLIDKHKKL